MADSWLTVRCRVAETDVEKVEGVLELAGAAAITCQGSEADAAVFDTLDGEYPLWPVCEITGLFDLDTELGGLQDDLSACGIPPHHLQIETLHEENWHESWRDQFSAQQFGGRIWVCPTWTEPPVGEDFIVRIDPGMAFGTGNHETTALCLEWLATNDHVCGARVLDYGCGSGILALAAARLGASEVAAVDIDPQAINVACANAELNQIRDITFTQPGSVHDRCFDIIVANILLEPLTQLAETFTALIAPGGQIVLSGILREQVEPLLACYTAGFKIDTVQHLGDWALVAGRRSSRTNAN
jgi:ribosomal protein L11 methyltransferase